MASSGVPSMSQDAILNEIRAIDRVLGTFGPGHADIPYYHSLLEELYRQLDGTQRRSNPSIAPSTSKNVTIKSEPESSASASRKRGLGLAEMPVPKRVSANPSPTTPGTPDPFYGMPASQQNQMTLPNRPAYAANPRTPTPFIDLTESAPMGFAPINDPFPELNDAYRDDGIRMGPADAFNQEWLSETELAQFLITPGPTNGGYASQQQQQQAPGDLFNMPGLSKGNPATFQETLLQGPEVPYMPGPDVPHWGLQESDSDDYGDFPLNPVEVASLEKMLEAAHQHGDEDTPDDREQTPRIMQCTLKEYQKIGLTWLVKMEESPGKGGILADEMGLGKTVQALALICARPSQDPLCKTTLIIAPVALMRQWEKEIARHVQPRHKLRVYLYWGKGKKADFSVLRQYDVVLTTFGTLTSEFKQKDSPREAMLNEQEIRKKIKRKGKEKLALLGRECMWYRIIIDEAHNIKNRNAIASKAAAELMAKHRLCMTGTPMMNSVDELYPLLRFLRIDRYNDWRVFSQDFVKPVKANHPETRKKAIKRVQILLRAVMLRRQKSSEVDGKPILQLPPKHITLDNVEFSDDEHGLYKALEEKSQIQFNKYLKQNSVTANYANILVLLLRLRQACCHPHLIKDLSQPATEGIAETDLLERADDLAGDVVERLKEFDSFECPICLEADPNPTIIIPCGHTVCGVCVQKLIDPARAGQDTDEAGTAKCPHCRGELKAKYITDFKHFCRVHCPERLPSEERVEEEDDSDSEIDEDDDIGEDIDEKGNLAGFVVSDDEDAEEDLQTQKDQDDNSGSWSEDNAEAKKGKGKVKVDRKGKARAKPKQTLAQLKKESLRSKAAKKKYLRRLERGWIPSAKILELVEVLSNIRKQDPTEKTLVFSQFTSLLDLIEVPLLQKKFRYQRYDGSMTLEARADAVDAFMENPEENIMLVSLRAGNAGLNLWRASQVVIMDPFWNPFVEEQAVDRAHRMPQEREVTVHRILVPETVEDRICALQDKKREIIGQALDENAAKSLTRLGLTELKYLFGLT